MTELITLFRKLSEYFDSSLKWEHLKKIFEEESEDSKKRLQDEYKSQADIAKDAAMYAKKPASVINLPMIDRALKEPELLSTLLDICTVVRSLRESNRSYDNTYDCWNEVVKVSPRDHYLAFIYGLVGIGTIESVRPVYMKLALATAKTYFLSLTIPGAKGFHIFEEEVIAHVLKIFGLVEKLKSQYLEQCLRQDAIDILVIFGTLCDDIKLLFRYVHFIDYKLTWDRILRTLIELQFRNYKKINENKYAANLHFKCFEIFDEMINPHNGDPEETLMKIMNMSAFLHTYPTKSNFLRGDKKEPKNPDDCLHISDWFIKCSHHLQWNMEQTLNALDYASKYDAALFKKCNVSCVDYVSEAAYADELMIRVRAVDLSGRMLLHASNVNWNVFRHEISDIPRELHLIKLLIDSLEDYDDYVKFKALKGLQSSIIEGSANTQRVFNECLRFVQFDNQNVIIPEAPRISEKEIRYEKPSLPTPTYSFKGAELVESSFLRLPKLIYTKFFQNSLSHVRRAGIVFIKLIVKLNPLIIFNTNFLNLVFEPTPSVRKEALLTIDYILSCYPNCYPVILVWCKICAAMLRDADEKNNQTALKCFCSQVLLNLKGIDESNKAEHFMPWVILRTLLGIESRVYLQACFQSNWNSSMFDSFSGQILSTIQSHLLTNNSTEAWVLLSFASGKVKMPEPDSLLNFFTSLKSWDQLQNMPVALEVLSKSINDFSHSALNLAFDYILKTIRDGSILPANVSKSFDFLLQIDNRSRIQSTHLSDSSCSNDDHPKDNAFFNHPWILDLNNFLETCILKDIETFPENHSVVMSHLFSYTEVNFQTLLRTNDNVINFVHNFISAYLELSEAEFSLEKECLFNLMIVAAGRFALRDAEVASTTRHLFGHILQKIDRPPVVNTIVVAFTDLCKEHTLIAEGMIPDLLRKLESSYSANRIATFKCFAQLVLKEQLKLRGMLLLALLKAIVSESKYLALLASNFFESILKKNNPTLFKKCLVECPYVLNNFKSYDSLNIFTNNVASQLSGDRHRQARQKLYNHLIKNFDEVNLLLYFGNLKRLADMSEFDQSMKSAEGIAFVKDMLFILRRVCEIAGKNHSAPLNRHDKDPKCADDDIVLKESSSLVVEIPAAEGRTSRRRGVTTISDAISVLKQSVALIPIIHKHTIDIDSSVGKFFDELGVALAKHFSNIIATLEPVEFWDQYRKLASKLVTQSTTPKSSRKRISSTNDDLDEDIGEEEEEEEKESGNDDDFDSSEFEDHLDEGMFTDDTDGCDNTMDHSETTPLELHSPPKRKCVELPEEYVFNP